MFVVLCHLLIDANPHPFYRRHGGIFRSGAPRGKEHYCVFQQVSQLLFIGNPRPGGQRRGISLHMPDDVVIARIIQNTQHGIGHFVRASSSQIA